MEEISVWHYPCQSRNVPTREGRTQVQPTSPLPARWIHAHVAHPGTLWTINTHNKDLLDLTARNNFRIRTRLVLGSQGLELLPASGREEVSLKLPAGSVRRVQRTTPTFFGYMPRPRTETKRVATRSDPRALDSLPILNVTRLPFGIPWIERHS